MVNHKSNFDKLWLLVWKNLKLQIRHPIRTFLELAIPVIMLLIMLWSKKMSPPEERGPHAYPSFLPISTEAFLTNKRNIYWSPCENNEVQEIMKRVVVPYQLNEKCFKDAQELDTATNADVDSTFGAVAFEDSLSGKKDIGEKVKITIRLPSGIHSQDDWRTDGIYNVRLSSGPKHWDNIYGASSPDYFGLGFLTLQHDISITLIKIKINKTGGTDDSIPVIKLNRFPHPLWLDEPFLYTLRHAIGPQLAFSFVVSCIGSVQDITREKQKQIKEAMKVIGLANWLCWLSWFIRILTCMLLTMTILLIMLATPIISGQKMNVFKYANFMVVLIFFIFYICATATLCFMISVFFRRASSAIGFAGIIWFLSSLPYIKCYPFMQSPRLSAALAIMLTPNSAFCVGMHVIIMFEETSEGLTFENICRPIHPGYTISMCHVILMLSIDALIYLAVALYLEALYPGEYGIPKRWDFLCHKSYWTRQNKRTTVSSSSFIRESDRSEAFEPEPTGMQVGIAIKNLKKVFPKNTAVDGINLNIYRGQITVLLGHNGAGKSTTMTMVAGTVPPTEGTIIVNGYTIPEELSEARSSLGWCPQHNILFDELTVGEHLYLFSRLKGASKCESEDEVKKFIKLLALTSKKNKQSKTLSGGMKRKLCAALALCGNSQVCLFDEPSSGVDPGARRDLWDIIQSQKEGRTILLTTQFMDEADVLGDRIAIMVAGKLQCCGSGFFLKKKFGSGYKLIIVKGPNCNVDGITGLLQKYIPTAGVNSNDASELTYLLPEDNVAVFKDMLRDLENNSVKLGIASYGISVTTMEEVFLRVGNVEEHTEEATKNKKSKRKVADVDSLSINSISAWQYLSGGKLKVNQFRAMLMKKYLCSLRSKIVLVQLAIVAILMTVIGIEQFKDKYTPEQPPRLLSISMYPSPIVMMTTNSLNNTYYEGYQQLLKEKHVTYLDWEMEDFSDEVLDYIESHPYDWRWHAIFGATFSDEEILTWFNPEGFHSVAVALQYTLNTVYRIKVNPHCEIEFENHPLPNTASAQLMMMGGDMVNTAHLLTIALIFSTAFFIFYYIRERKTRSMHLQCVAGVDIRIYWITSYLWDYLTFLIFVAVIVICFASFGVDGFSTFPEIGRLILLLVLFGFAILFEMHLLSYVLSSAEAGVAKAVFLNYFLGPIACLMMGTIILEALRGTKLMPYVNHVCIALYFVPSFALSSALFQLGQKNAENKICEELNATIQKSEAPVSACQITSICCGNDENYLGWEPRGIGKQLLILSLFSTIAVIIIFLKEYDIHKILKYKASTRMTKRLESDETVDDDVLEEQRMIRNDEVKPEDCYILVKDLCKRYKKFVAVNGLCLAVRSFECFGLLGVNGAGKTTTFRMISGDLSITSGECWIYSYNIKRHPKKAMSSIGYCPQFDSLLDELTGFETLIMYSLLTGIPFAQCHRAADIMAKKFDFYIHLHKQVKKYSGGNKRKLSTAIAFIGEPPIVFLDEPTTGMDPATRRKLWDNLIRERDNGKCLILTSHSMEECEAMCTRVAIMVNGTFICLGSTQHLKNKFSQGHVLTIKMKEVPIVSREGDMSNVKDFVQQSFEDAALTEDHFGLLIFYIPSKNVTWSTMFGKLEEAKKTLNIDDYSISQSSLQEVFIYLTKSQRADSSP